MREAEDRVGGGEGANGVRRPQVAGGQWDVCVSDDVSSGCAVTFGGGRVAQVVERTLRNGTTSALYFGTIHLEATKVSQGPNTNCNPCTRCRAALVVVSSMLVS